MGSIRITPRAALAKDTEVRLVGLDRWPGNGDSQAERGVVLAHVTWLWHREVELDDPIGQEWTGFV